MATYSGEVVHGGMPEEEQFFSKTEKSIMAMLRELNPGDALVINRDDE